MTNTPKTQDALATFNAQRDAPVAGSEMAALELENARLRGAVAKLFALPNWKNRCGEWKDVNAAINELHNATLPH